MKLIYAQGFTKNERLEGKPVVFNNVVHSMRTIFDVMSDQGIEFENKENEVRNLPRPAPHSGGCLFESRGSNRSSPTMQKNQALVLADHEISPNDPLPESFLEPIKSLWADAGVQKAILKGNEYALHDNLG